MSEQADQWSNDDSQNDAIYALIAEYESIKRIILEIQDPQVRIKAHARMQWIRSTLEAYNIVRFVDEKLIRI